MDFLELAKARYSCKKFSDKPVEKEKLEQVLEAGRLAPTAKNNQPQHIYVLSSKESLALTDQLTPCRYGAPVVLAVAHDKENVFEYPGGAYNSANSTWYNSTQRYAVGQWTCSKSVQTSAPTYATSGTQNQGVTTAIYKNSTSSSTSYTRTSGMNTNVYSSSNATNAAVTCVRYKYGNILSVYVNTSSYGLFPGIEYEYQIIYSS